MLRMESLVLFAFVLAGCATDRPLSEHGYGHVTTQLTTQPDPIPCNAPFDLWLQVDGAKVEKIDLHAFQPSTGLQLLEPVDVVVQKDGRWKAENLLLPGPGSWEIAIDLHYNGRIRHCNYAVTAQSGRS